MNRWIMVLLLNQFVMPGFGYLLIKEKVRAVLVMAAAFLAVFIPLYFFLSSTSQFMQQTSPASNPVALAMNAMQQSLAGNRTLLAIAGIGLGIIWCYCLLDVIIRRKQITHDGDVSTSVTT